MPPQTLKSWLRHCEGVKREDLIFNKSKKNDPTDQVQFLSFLNLIFFF